MRPPNSQLQKFGGGELGGHPIFPFENFERGELGGHPIVTLKTHKGSIKWPPDSPFRRVSKGENQESTECSPFQNSRGKIKWSLDCQVEKFEWGIFCNNLIFPHQRNCRRELGGHQILHQCP
jgi:hypothetical protein